MDLSAVAFPKGSAVHRRRPVSVGGKLMVLASIAERRLGARLSLAWFQVTAMARAKYRAARAKLKQQELRLAQLLP